MTIKGLLLCNCKMPFPLWPQQILFSVNTTYPSICDYNRFCPLWLQQILSMWLQQIISTVNKKVISSLTTTDEFLCAWTSPILSDSKKEVFYITPKAFVVSYEWALLYHIKEDIFHVIPKGISYVIYKGQYTLSYTNEHFLFHKSSFAFHLNGLYTLSYKKESVMSLQWGVFFQRCNTLCHIQTGSLLCYTKWTLLLPHQNGFLPVIPN